MINKSIEESKGSVLANCLISEKLECCILKMGACFCQSQDDLTHPSFVKKLKVYIDTDDAMGLQTLLGTAKKFKNVLNFDHTDQVLAFEGLQLTPIGYAVYTGASDCLHLFLALNSNALWELHAEFRSLNPKPIEIICERGYVSILEYYLPFYLENRDVFLPQTRVLPIESEFSAETIEYLEETSSGVDLSPVQRACKNNKIEILCYLSVFFAKTPPPYELDAEFIDKNTGENCALLACKVGSLSLLKYLFEVRHANFQIYNHRQEGALQIVAANSKRNQSINYFLCFRYLVEVVEVDFLYLWEETLLILEDFQIIYYLVALLAKKNIVTSKEEVERRFYAEVLPRKLNFRHERAVDYQFVALFNEECEQISIPSSIPDSSSLNLEFSD